MNKRHIFRALTAILACSILSAGAIACGSGDAEDKLAQVEKTATQNLVDVELMKDRLDKAEEANTKLTERLDALEKSNQELTQSMLLGAMGGGATDMGAAYNAASEEQRQLVRTFLECPTLSGILGGSEKDAWATIESGAQNLTGLQAASALLCN